MRNLLEVCCGVDVHKEVLVTCMLKGGIDEEPEPVIREFPTLLYGLDEFKKWVIENDCHDVAMESTGVYWFPIYNVLESVFYEEGQVNIIVANPHHMKNVPGKKTDIMWECGVGIFVTIPFVTFCVLSGLQSIDAAYYEAATVDGANFWQKLRHVTIPLVMPSLTVSTVLNIIYVFNSFPIIYTITKGALANKTDTLITYLYMLAFYDQKKGTATALSVIGFTILCLVSGIYMMMTMKKEDA